jgi:hypothetical protein
MHGSSSLWFHGFLLVPPKPRFLSSSKIERGIIWFGKKPFLGTCSLCWGDPCVQVSFDLKKYSSRIKLGNKGADFGRKSCFPETSYRTMSGPTLTWTRSDLQFWVSRNLKSDNIWLYRTMSDPTRQCMAPPDIVRVTVSARHSFTLLAIFC